MSVLVNEQTRVVVQGLTGREGSFHAEQMIAYGTKVVAGVTPGKGGALHLNVPVFDTVVEAVRVAHANVAAIFDSHRGDEQDANRLAWIKRETEARAARRGLLWS